jgi:hypothetical protein
MTVVDNARYEPEQILLLKSSSPVVETAMAGGITVRLLPARHRSSALKTSASRSGRTQKRSATTFSLPASW